MPMKCYVCGDPGIAQDVCYDHAVLCERCGKQPCSPRIKFCTDCFIANGQDTVISCSCVLSYLAAIVVANWAVSVYGQVALPFTAFILIPFDLMARDVLHDRWRSSLLWPKMFALIVAGSLLSYFSSLATAQVSIASAVSFLVTGVVDTTVYHLLDKQKRFVKMNASNICSAATDSILFPLIAFGAFSPFLSLAQAITKIAGGAIWTGLYFVLLHYLNKGKQLDVYDPDDYS